MPLGTFTLTIGGERQDGTAETKAKLHLRPQGVDTLIDADADLFYFPTQFADGRGVNISLSPTYSIDLYTDTAAGEGESTTIGYEGWVRTDQGRVDFQIAAQEAGATVSLTDLVDTVVVPVSTAQGYVTEAEAARDAALAAEASAETAQTAAETAAASVQREQASGVAGLTSAGKLYETRIPDRLSDASLSATIGAQVARREMPVILPPVSDFKGSEPSATITLPTYDGTNIAVHPSVVHVPSGWNGYRYWMAMTPYSGSDPELENPSILRSQDGYTWTVPTGLTNPIVASPAGSAYNSDTHLVLDPGGVVMHLYYRDYGVGGSRDRILHMTSTNGTTWTTPAVIVDTDVAVQRIVSPAVWYEPADDQWVMLGVDIVGTQTIKRATAPAPEGPWSSFTAVTLVGGLPAGRLPWHLDAHPIGDAVIVMVVDGNSAGGNLYLMSSTDQGRTLTVAADMLAGDRYRSCFVPVVGPRGVALDCWLSKLDGKLTRMTTTTDVDLGPLLGPRLVAPYVFGDSFNRADNASGLGAADSGHTYTVTGGTAGISGNAAYVTTAANITATVDTGLSDGIASVRHRVIGSTRDQWMYFRHTDDSNSLRVGITSAGVVLQKVVGGSATVLATFASRQPVSGDTITAIYRGSQITVMLNGAPIIRVTETAQQTATKIGFRMRVTDARMDDFTFRRL